MKNNTFKNIRESACNSQRSFCFRLEAFLTDDTDIAGNIDGTGVQGPSVQALYLDDQMSGWEVGHNRFINCMAGSFIGCVSSLSRLLFTLSPAAYHPCF